MCTYQTWKERSVKDMLIMYSFKIQNKGYITVTASTYYGGSHWNCTGVERCNVSRAKRVRSPRCSAFELVPTSPPSGNTRVRVIRMAVGDSSPPAGTIGVVPEATTSISTSISAPVYSPTPTSIEARNISTFGCYLDIFVLYFHVPII